MNQLLHRTLLSLGLSVFFFLQNLVEIRSSDKKLNYLLRKAEVGVESLNLRHGPGTQYKILEVLSGRQRLQYLPEPRRGWVRVTTEDGTTGWTFLKFLKPDHSRKIFPEKNIFQIYLLFPIKIKKVLNIFYAKKKKC